MKIGSFEFNLRELAGFMGDFGTLLPLAIVAIAHRWTLRKIYTSGLVMGIVWMIMGAIGAMTYVARWTPKSVVRGIQLSLGLLLALEGIKMVRTWWL